MKTEVGVAYHSEHTPFADLRMKIYNYKIVNSIYNYEFADLAIIFKLSNFITDKLRNETGRGSPAGLCEWGCVTFVKDCFLESRTVHGPFEARKPKSRPRRPSPKSTFVV